jgi:hypothetical protein
VQVPALVDGTAFFAAGPGLYCEQPPSAYGLPPFPFGGTIVIGNNLDAAVPYRRRLAMGIPHGDRDRPMRTWRHLYQLLELADVDPRRCFFTNAHVGLVAGAKPLGQFPGARDPNFTAWCARFLRYQINVMRPVTLVTLGAAARRFLGRLSADLGEWPRPRPPDLRVHDARIDDHPVRAIHLAHPSMYPASAAHRQFAGATGIDAEVALLRAAHW